MLRVVGAERAQSPRREGTVCPVGVDLAHLCARW